MFEYTQWHRTVILLMILSTGSFLVACGGEEGGDSGNGSSADNGSSVGAGLVCFAYLLVSGDDECLDTIISSSSGSSSSSNDSSVSGNPIAFRPLDEYEPNNAWQNANPVEFPRTSDRDGFIIDGDVNDILDPVDSFTFTRSFQRYHAFRLCSDGQMYCDQSGEIDTLTAYIDIVDQSGKILASSQARDSNYLRLELAGGVPYYVMVLAADTMATTVKYHLVGHEANY